MSLNKVPSGRNLPDDFNVIIEIPMNADPIKYEVDKESGAIFVDRFMGTAMHYPCNYGYVPHTIADDGDPVRVGHHAFSADPWCGCAMPPDRCAQDDRRSRWRRQSARRASG